MNIFDVAENDFTVSIMILDILKAPFVYLIGESIDIGSSIINNNFLRRIRVGSPYFD